MTSPVLLPNLDLKAATAVLRILGLTARALVVVVAEVGMAAEVLAQLPSAASPPSSAVLVASSAVPSRQLVGIVIDAASGRPVKLGRVDLVGTMLRAHTDSSGRFSIQDLPDGPLTASVRSPGYDSLRVTFTPTRGIGVVARFELRAVPIRECGLIVSASDGITGSVVVEVRDVLTGRAPDSPVALRVSRSGATYWDTRRDPSESPAVRLAAGQGPGPFTIEVAAAGFASWSRDGVVGMLDECGILRSPAIPVWLLPLRSATPRR